MEEAAEALARITLRVQALVNDAQKKLWEGQIEGLKQYSDPDGEPLVERFRLSGGRVFEVPRRSLVPQNWLGIDEVALTFTLSGKPEQAGQAEEKQNIVERIISLFGRKKKADSETKELYEVKVIFRPDGRG